MNRYTILLCAFAMQLCLGATYSWSVFVAPVRIVTGLTQGSAQLPFSFFYFVFPATMMAAGWFLPRLGPRRSAMLGGALFGAGWMLASLGRFHFAFTVLGIGCIAGAGVGFAYIVPITVGVQWFPHNKGLVTGVAVAGFGGGAALVAWIAESLMRTSSFSPFDVFLLLGAGFLIVVLLAGSAMQFPSIQHNQEDVSLPVSQIVGRKEFLLLYGAMIAGLVAGFVVNANLKELSIAPAGGAAAISLFAVCNALGRFIWGAAFDRMRSTTALSLNLVLQALTACAMPWLSSSEAGFLAFAGLAGFNYGGVLVLYASAAGRIWGPERLGQVYGLLFSANIVAAPAPVIAGMVFDATGSFTVTMILLTIVLGGASVLIVTHARLLNRAT